MSTATLVDLVILVTVVEGVVLLLWRLATVRAIPIRDFLVNMTSGLCLMLALRCLANGTGVHWIALWLLAAGIAHATDIALRWLPLLQTGDRPETDRASLPSSKGQA